MNIIKFSDPELFQSVVKEHLLKHEAENNLPLGILSSLIAGEYRDQIPYLGQVKDQGETKLVVMCTPPYPVLISFEEKPLDEEVVSMVIDDLVKELGDNLTGMTGSKNIVSQFADTWQAAAGRKAILKMAMHIYKLVRVSPVYGVPGSIRPANEADKSLLLDWYGNFHRESFVEKPDPERIKVQVERYLSADPHLRGMMIWEDGGNPVSMARLCWSHYKRNSDRCCLHTPGAAQKGLCKCLCCGVNSALAEYRFPILFPIHGFIESNFKPYLSAVRISNG